MLLLDDSAGKEVGHALGRGYASDRLSGFKQRNPVEPD
jgi:hypothetical protein